MQVPECPQHVQAWVAEMSAFVKRVDPNHLVTIGEEGFFASDRPEARVGTCTMRPHMLGRSRHYMRQQCSFFVYRAQFS